jgi:hypothetical protein
MLGLAPLLAAGCLAGYVYPKVSYIPRLDIEAPPQQVWAFAVYNQRERVLSLPAGHEITLRPLPQQSTLGPQADLTLEHGYWLWSGLRKSDHVSHHLSVRLYRRGHRTIEVGSWDLFDDVRWIRAEGTAEQEQAIDDLVAPPREGDGQAVEVNSFEHLGAGSADPRHRQALLFAAAEYETLAKRPGLDDATRNRLLDKARHLNARAEK